MKKRIPIIFLSVILILGILPLSGIFPVAAEEDGQELAEFRFYNENEKIFQKSVCTLYTQVGSTTTAWENGFYVADGETVIESRVTVTGDVFLILKDGCTLTINGGIAVNEGNSLTVFSQSEGENTGILIADSGNNRNCSGIGSGRGRSCGTVNIHGGHITATGGYEGAGIGSAKDTVGGAVNIYGGIITANSVRDGGGIGSGKGGSVNIYGGIVNAGCEDNGSGIDGDFTLYGGNVNAIGDGNGISGSLMVYGGAFNAVGGLFGTGISGSAEAAADIDLINLNDGSIYTKDEWKNIIGSGPVSVCAVKSNEPMNYLAYDTETGEFTNRKCEDYRFINKNTDTLTDGWYVVMGTLDLDCITVNGNVSLILTDWCVLTAEEDYDKAGIGITLGNSLTVYAQSDDEKTGNLIATGGVGIGSIENRLGGIVSIHGGIINATGSDGGAGIGGGYKCGMDTINIYGGIINANGGPSGAGIGGGQFGHSGTINIYGGIINANGGPYGAGIGCGVNGSGNTINIYGGIINATGSDGGAGIGGGYSGYGADLSIYGGRISAKGGSEGIAIGNGKSQTNNKLWSLTVGENLSVINGETGEPIQKGEGQEWKDAVKCPYVLITDAEEPEQFEKTDYLEYNNGSFLNRTCEKDTYIPCPFIPAWQYDWYEVEGKLTVDAVQVKGDVKLILKDGCELTVRGGINVEAGNRLTIYAQSEGDSAGKLIAEGTVYQAGMGSGLDGDCGSIVIEGGVVTAYGGVCAAGIGGGSGSSYGGDITIFGGVIFAKGQDGGAGIGSGYYDYAEYDADVMEFTDKATAGSITIRGGLITAQGSAYAAGIGGGAGSDGGNITICAGSITAESGTNGEAGIGDGCFETEDGYVTVYGGKVTVAPENGTIIKASLADGNEADGSPYKTETDITADIRSDSWIHLNTVDEDNPIVAPEPASPQTADRENTVFWLVLTVLSSVGLCVCAVKNQEKAKKIRKKQ